MTVICVVLFVLPNHIPEITINNDGIFWHPLSSDPDLLLRTDSFPLVEAVLKIQTGFEKLSK